MWVKEKSFIYAARILVLVEEIDACGGCGLRQILRWQNQIIQPVNKEIISK